MQMIYIQNLFGVKRIFFASLAHLSAYVCFKILEVGDSNFNRVSNFQLPLGVQMNSDFLKTMSDQQEEYVGSSHALNHFFVLVL